MARARIPRIEVVEGEHDWIPAQGRRHVLHLSHVVKCAQGREIVYAQSSNMVFVMVLKPLLLDLGPVR